MTYNYLLEKVPKLIASLRQNDWHVTVFDIFYKMRYIDMVNIILVMEDK